MPFFNYKKKRVGIIQDLSPTTPIYCNLYGNIKTLKFIDDSGHDYL